ncbi:MAG: ABC transporter ATP-binding protein [Defluviitaleaceae bacterium]|nr:ABC transporter ATP-binding protein [Defluviitaleaceae bacterium]
MYKLEVKNLRFSYNETIILDNFALKLEKGEVCGLKGFSGAGKTTILRIIAGLEVIKNGHGHIYIDGKDITNLPPEKRGIGFVFQDYGLFPHRTVEKNISYGLFKYSKAEKKQIIDEMLKLINMEDKRKSYPYELSGGQQQRVALARSLAPKPKLLLLDEPFSNIDSELKNSIRKEIKRILTETEATCILSTHDDNDIKEVCSRMYSL